MVNSFRRVLLSVSDKEGIVQLAQAFSKTGAELVATGRTAKVLEDAGLKVTPIEKVSGSPEAFRGRMKTLSFPICSGILYRRGDDADEMDLTKLKIQPIDAVVVNFYPFEAAAAKPGISKQDLIEEVDIGGPTLVRAAAKNSPSVLVLTSPRQYPDIIQELESKGGVKSETAIRFAAEAWDHVLSYDTAIARELGTSAQMSQTSGPSGKKALRYGENPHQEAWMEWNANSPIAWDEALTQTELSYNNILDLSAAYALASDLKELSPDSTGVVIIKHNNPCGVATVPQKIPNAQKQALIHAWQGDPVSAFGGVLVFTDPIQNDTAEWLRGNFVELVAAPDLSGESPSLKLLLEKRKNLRALRIRRFGEVPKQGEVVVPGGKLTQTSDVEIDPSFNSVTQIPWPAAKTLLAKFGVCVGRALKSNAIALVREITEIPGGMQLVGAGQGQPNRIDALKDLALPRAKNVLRHTESKIEDCVMISDAFFPFRDTVDSAYAGGVRLIVQPGGSLKDAESIAACNEHGISMVFTGRRHFRH